jgi:hypothetical protein
VKYITVNTDAYLFNAPAGGLYSTAANWQDTTTSATATAAPSYGNAVTIAGGLTYTNVTGNGFAASLATSGDVLLWGSLTVGSKVSGVSGALVQTGALGPANNRLDLDGAASLALVGQAQVAGSVLVGGGSKLTAAGGLAFTQSSASLQAIGGSSAQFASVSGVASFFSYGYTTYSYPNHEFFGLTG